MVSWMFKDKDTIKILSIDGGGIRGIIPALIIAEIEKKTGQKISDLFDFIAGTSTGALLSILLTKKNPLPAKQLISMYEKFGKAVFSSKSSPITRFNKKIQDIIKTNINSIQGPKYETKGIETVLNFILGNSKLQEINTPLLLTAYETTKRESILFKNYDQTYSNIKLKDIARAVSAAPTYFEPIEIDGLGTFVDGGIGATNPAMCAYTEVIKLIRETGENPYNKKIVVVSLGTGCPNSPYTKITLKKLSSVEWIDGPIMPFFFGANIAYTDQQLKNLLPSDCYFRFQIELNNTPEAEEMDNVSKDNIQSLKKLTLEYIKNNQELEKLCHTLSKQSIFA